MQLLMLLVDIKLSSSNNNNNSNNSNRLSEEYNLIISKAMLLSRHQASITFRSNQTTMPSLNPNLLLSKSPDKQICSLVLT